MPTNCKAMCMNPPHACIVVSFRIIVLNYAFLNKNLDIWDSDNKMQKIPGHSLIYIPDYQRLIFQTGVSGKLKLKVKYN